MTKKDLKIVFFGTPDFAVESLDRLIKDGHDIAAVVTATDKPAGRGHHMLQSAVKEYAVSHGLRLLQPSSLKDSVFVDQLREIGADLFIVIAFRMLPEIVWTMPPMGTFNLHGSLLPRYRGAAPINWAIINGDRETGVTTFFLKHEIDTGDIIDQVRIEIGPDEDFGSVYGRLMHIGADLTARTVRRIIDGDLMATPQDADGQCEPSPAPKVFKDTCRIDWSRQEKSIHDLVRGLSPHPGAWSNLIDKDGRQSTVKIFKTARIGTQGKGSPGSISSTGGRLTVTCGNGLAIEILKLQPAGKKRMSAADYLRGARIDGCRFESE